MASTETQIVDDVIVNTRRKMLTLGGTALAGMLLADAPSAKAQNTAIGDTDILNFALNLEYLEANFYYLAAFGTTIDVSNAASTAAGALKLGITGTGTQGSVVVKANPKVNFASDIASASYCIETAIEEGKHVNFLRSTLGPLAVAQPQIDLMASFNALSAASGIGPTFDPFSSAAFFLVGAYIFEDVGVSAYLGAAPLISTTATGKTYLAAAAGILAVEAYHAGLVRTSLYGMDASTNSTTLTGLTTQISNKRAGLAAAAANAAVVNPFDPNPDDYGIATFTTPATLGSGTAATATTPAVPPTTAMASRLVDANPANVIAFQRTTLQVLNIVTGGGAGTATTPISPAKGVFFPNGMNGLIK